MCVAGCLFMRLVNTSVSQSTHDDDSQSTHDDDDDEYTHSRENIWLGCGEVAKESPDRQGNERAVLADLLVVLVLCLSLWPLYDWWNECECVCGVVIFVLRESSSSSQGELCIYGEEELLP